MNSYRDLFIHELSTQLIGPAGGEEEEISGKPFHRYMSGILFPSQLDMSAVMANIEPESTPNALEEDVSDPSLGMAYSDLPSSMGISFFLRQATQLEIKIRAARYSASDREARDTTWKRTPLEQHQSAVQRVSVPAHGDSEVTSLEVFDAMAILHVIFRAREGGHLVTASLMNGSHANDGSMYDPDQIEAMLFQCGFCVETIGGHIGEYPRVPSSVREHEDEELELAYRNRVTYGIGHGCSAVWDHAEEGHSPTRIRAESLPVTEVRGLTNDIDLPEEASKVLSMQWLANPDTGVRDLRQALQEFTNAYESWIARQVEKAGSLAGQWTDASERLLSKQRVALERMRSGIDLLSSKNDDVVLQAFRLAQEAMLRQFLWRQRISSPCAVGSGQVETVDVWSSKYASEPRWRPFQLAYQLLVLESLAKADSKYRDDLDLLWFPTGGGKTEAYLFLASFEIFRRRLKFRETGSGTTVLMRYTLRLLTAQQFERCATLISAMEVMRRKNVKKLGSRRIKLGLWVGADSSPNKLDSPVDRSPGALQLFEGLLEDSKPENPFQLSACPSCGTRIVPAKKGPPSDYGLRIDQYRFEMFCPDKRCQLHDSIPVSVVDEDLFNDPPTFLVGTIDKFARMAWDTRSKVFFGYGQGGCLPPALVIQDELHLITGPLGTISGVYEAAIDTLIKKHGAAPKYIAATATIQRAQEQSRSLYARNANVFPPIGIDCNDSFYSKEDIATAGRKYIGAMGNAMYSSLTSLIQSSFACAYASGTAIDRMATGKTAVKGTSKLQDAYWTQVIYHNSRQELGKTTTMLQDDVRKRLEILAPEVAEKRAFDQIQELSANLRGREISDALQNISVELPSESTVDVLACTNMISVGVDIPRLGLMIVKGQPKTTSEYIQASSRVGRDSKRPGGVVLTVYSVSRPRDRSHYESFQSYHQKLYKEVEPVTVTPFAPPALERTLHAAIIIVLRMALGWDDREDARNFDAEDRDVKDLLTRLLSRLEAACREDERQDLQERFWDIVTTWAQISKEPGPPLIFSKGGKQFRRLIGEFGEPNILWPTLNSMRHVDGETPFYVRGTNRK